LVDNVIDGKRDASNILEFREERGGAKSVVRITAIIAKAKLAKWAKIEVRNARTL
jgi:hypothetical protein